jgi:hypothetical protein
VGLLPDGERIPGHREEPDCQILVGALRIAFVASIDAVLANGFEQLLLVATNSSLPSMNLTKSRRAKSSLTVTPLSM